MASPDYLTVILSSLGGTVAALGIARILFELLLRQFLNRQLEAFKSAQNAELESLKSELRTNADRVIFQSNTYSGELFKRKLEAVEEIYPALLKFNEVIKEYRRDITPLAKGETASSVHEALEKNFSEFQKAFYLSYIDNKIYLSTELRSLIDIFLDKTFKMVHLKLLTKAYLEDPDMRQFIPSNIETANKLFDEDILKIISQLDEEFEAK